MIADTAIFSPSPWQGDISYNKDVSNMSQSPNISDMSITALEAEIERVKRQSELAFEHMSCGTSVASSECGSDEFYLETESLLASDTDSSELLGGFTNTGPQYGFDLQLDSMEWNDPNPTLSELFEEDSPSHNASSCSYSSTSKKHWSDLSRSEQNSAFDNLMKVITGELDLREQLEVIRILQPSGSVNPTDTQFLVDLDNLNDEKYEQVEKYVQEHRKTESDLKTENSDSNSSSSPRKPSKRQKKVQQKEMKQRQRKEYRQMMKERRSGLFAKEEVLALSTGVVLEEEDSNEIDILT